MLQRFIGVERDNLNPLSFVGATTENFVRLALKFVEQNTKNVVASKTRGNEPRILYIDLVVE